MTQLRYRGGSKLALILRGGGTPLWFRVLHFLIHSVLIPLPFPFGCGDTGRRHPQTGSVIRKTHGGRRKHSILLRTAKRKPGIIQKRFFPLGAKFELLTSVSTLAIFNILRRGRNVCLTIQIHIRGRLQGPLIGLHLEGHHTAEHLR